MSGIFTQELYMYIFLQPWMLVATVRARHVLLKEPINVHTNASRHWVCNILDHLPRKLCDFLLVRRAIW